MKLIAALFLAVLLHVAWNLFTRDAPRKQEYIWWGLVGHLILFAPWSLYFLIKQGHWSGWLPAYLVISTLALSIYFISLRNAYEYAPVTLAYPIARSSPILIALCSKYLVGESLSFLGWGGILISTIGILMLALSAIEENSHHALPPAFSAALCTTVYSLSDKAAVAYLPTFPTKLGYVSASYLIAAVAYSAYLRFRFKRWTPAERPPRWKWFLAASSIGTAYALIIYVMSYIPAAYAVALLNAGIVIATLLSIFHFKEKIFWKQRLFWVVTLSIGLSMIGISI
ncbi:EamA family transporter [Thermodesulfobacteriota bacterium]